MCKRSLQVCRELHQARWIKVCQFPPPQHRILTIWLHRTPKHWDEMFFLSIINFHLSQACCDERELNNAISHLLSKFCYKELKMPVFHFYKYKLLLQYGDLEKYIHIISDNKHIIQTKIKKQQRQKKDYLLPTTHFWFMTLKHWGYFHWNACSNERIMSQILKKSVTRPLACRSTDKYARCELAVRLKCPAYGHVWKRELLLWKANGLCTPVSFTQLIPD